MIFSVIDVFQAVLVGHGWCKPPRYTREELIMIQQMEEDNVGMAEGILSAAEEGEWMREF